MLIAGTPLFPLYGVIEHRGRRTGTTFRTPVAVRAVGDGFVVPLPWGHRTDWCRNVRAAGSCIMRWKGRDYKLVRPEVIDDPDAARAQFGALQGALMSRFGITACLRLHHQRG